MPIQEPWPWTYGFQSDCGWIPLPSPCPVCAANQYCCIHQFLDPIDKKIVADINFVHKTTPVLTSNPLIEEKEGGETTRKGDITIERAAWWAKPNCRVPGCNGQGVLRYSHPGNGTELIEACPCVMTNMAKAVRNGKHSS